MAEVGKAVEPKEVTRPVSGDGRDERELKLVGAMLAAKMVDIKPQLDFTTELGFLYPVVEHTLNVKGQEAVTILESLTNKGILRKSFVNWNCGLWAPTT
jgi:hypothetical protein